MTKIDKTEELEDSFEDEELLDSEESFDFSTAALDATPITIDGDPYEMKTVDHLSKAQEARVRVLFRDETRLGDQLDKTKPTDDKKRQRLSERMSDKQIEILSMMINAPKAKIAELRQSDRSRVIRHIFLVEDDE